MLCRSGIVTWRWQDCQSRERYVLSLKSFATIPPSLLALLTLPDLKQDHAVVMARFARDCIQRMNDLTKMLEVSLGPDTADLALRVGLHSGPVTVRANVGSIQDSMIQAPSLTPPSLYTSRLEFCAGRRPGSNFLETQVCAGFSNCAELMFLYDGSYKVIPLPVDPSKHRGSNGIQWNPQQDPYLGRDSRPVEHFWQIALVDSS